MSLQNIDFNNTPELKHLHWSITPIHDKFYGSKTLKKLHEMQAVIAIGCKDRRIE